MLQYYKRYALIAILIYIGIPDYTTITENLMKFPMIFTILYFYLCVIVYK